MKKLILIGLLMLTSGVCLAETNENLSISGLVCKPYSDMYTASRIKKAGIDITDFSCNSNQNMHKKLLDTIKHFESKGFELDENENKYHDNFHYDSKGNRTSNTPFKELFYAVLHDHDNHIEVRLKVDRNSGFVPDYSRRVTTFYVGADYLRITIVDSSEKVKKEEERKIKIEEYNQAVQEYNACTKKNPLKDLFLGHCAALYPEKPEGL